MLSLDGVVTYTCRASSYTRYNPTSPEFPDIAPGQARVCARRQHDNKMMICCQTNLRTTLRVCVQEVQKHRTPSDAWMIYRNKVYDVSGWHEVRVFG